MTKLGIDPDKPTRSTAKGSPRCHSYIEVRVPDLGNFAEVDVIDVLVKPGDTVEVDTPLVTLETEKATMDVPSTRRRRRREACMSQKGGKVSAGGARGYASRRRRGSSRLHRLPQRRRCRLPPPQQPLPRLAAAAAPQSLDVLVPDMGNFTEVGVIDVLVKPGDKVEVDTPLVTLETEKATMDVPSHGRRRGRSRARADGRQDFRRRTRRHAAAA